MNAKKLGCAAIAIVSTGCLGMVVLFIFVPAWLVKYTLGTPKIKALESPHINILIRNHKITVSNESPISCRSVRVTINGAEEMEVSAIKYHGFSTVIKGLGPKGQVTTPLSAFLSDTGKHFDGAKAKPERVGVAYDVSDSNTGTWAEDLVKDSRTGDLSADSPDLPSPGPLIDQFFSGKGLPSPDNPKKTK